MSYRNYPARHGMNLSRHAATSCFKMAAVGSVPATSAHGNPAGTSEDAIPLLRRAPVVWANGHSRICQSQLWL